MPKRQQPPITAKEGDRGQRYELRCKLDEQEITLGWSDRYPSRAVLAVHLHPTLHSPRVLDRLAQLGTSGGHA